MKENKISDALNHLDDDLLGMTNEFWEKKPKGRIVRDMLLVSAAAVLIIVGIAAVIHRNHETSANTKSPEDFTFSIVFGTYGISSYDSATGKLVKTNDASDVSKYTADVQLTEDQRSEVYRILFKDIDIFSYPDAYDPFNAPGAEFIIASEPSQTIIISVSAEGRTKTVTCSGIAYGSLEDCYCEEAKAFMKAENRIVELLTSLPEWTAFPEYEHFYY